MPPANSGELIHVQPKGVSWATVHKVRCLVGCGVFVVAIVVVKECSGKVLRSPSVPELCALPSLSLMTKDKLLSGSLMGDSLTFPSFINRSPCSAWLCVF